jgi:hypothetical protein
VSRFCIDPRGVAMTGCRPTSRPCRAGNGTSGRRLDALTPHIPENVSTWLVDWSLVTLMGNTMPPRDANGTRSAISRGHSLIPRRDSDI